MEGQPGSIFLSVHERKQQLRSIFPSVHGGDVVVSGEGGGGCSIWGTYFQDFQAFMTGVQLFRSISTRFLTERLIYTYILIAAFVFFILAYDSHIFSL